MVCFLAYFPYFEKKVGLRDHLAVSVFVYVSPLSFARQRLCKHVPAATDTRNNIIVGHAVFCAVRVVSKESLWVSACVSPYRLLGNGSVNTFPRQRIHATI
jgi:hypothetical protein